MLVSLLVCIAAFLGLIWLVRRDGVSLGLSIAYLALLLINHAPGAYAHLVADGQLGTDQYTAIGMGYTAVATVCFVLGVGLAGMAAPGSKVLVYTDRNRFAILALIGGWAFVWGLTPLRSIPSLGAAIEKGAAIWILGVALGLRYAVWQGRWRHVAAWMGALIVYPVMMLVLGGFLSYGAAAMIAATSVLGASARRHWQAYLGVLVAALASMTLFVNYFGNRDEMRAAVWSNAGMAERVDANLGMFRDFQIFSAENPKHLKALDERLNQNIFIGIAETRIRGGQVAHLQGRSISDAVLSLVPRALWPSKPVYGGSPAIVSEMTGLRLSQTTSFGVGQVMEFQVNFGLAGVIAGFVALGWLIGLLDRKAALAEARGDMGALILFFLPGIALLQPIGSLVELSGGAAAALVAAIGWRWLWHQWNARPASARVRHAGARPPGARR